MSWRSGKVPIPAMYQPWKVFDHLFGSLDPREDAMAAERRKAYQQSVFGAVKSDHASLKAQLGRADAEKLELFATGIRDLEVSLQRRAPVWDAGKRPAEQSYQRPEIEKMM